jgi:hypothetical protein
VRQIETSGSGKVLITGNEAETPTLGLPLGRGPKGSIESSQLSAFADASALGGIAEQKAGALFGSQLVNRLFLNINNL